MGSIPMYRFKYPLGVMDNTGGYGPPDVGSIPAEGVTKEVFVMSNGSEEWFERIQNLFTVFEINVSKSTLDKIKNIEESEILKLLYQKLFLAVCVKLSSKEIEEIIENTVSIMCNAWIKAIHDLLKYTGKNLSKSTLDKIKNIRNHEDLELLYEELCKAVLNYKSSKEIEEIIENFFKTYE
jgi:hypothetical protein